MSRLLPLLFLLLTAAPALAQPASAPTVAAAETAFESGLRAYRAGDFGHAYDGFIRAATEYGYNQRSTAAYLMAGKARYAAGDFEGAASAMTTLLARYPRTRYADEARRVRRRTLSRLEDGPTQAPEMTTLGITLPRGDEDAVFTQALFNGVRLAVDEYNAARPDAPVRMVFRGSGGRGVGAADAVVALAREGAEVVVGPLYSEEAVAAGGAAERERVVLIAPLATDERVSQGRRYVFQANPTFAARGRMMARYAVGERLGRLGTVAAEGTYGETMAAAFRDEAARLGEDLGLYQLLPAEEAWFQLAERVSAGELAAVDAVYFPVSGSDADEHAAGALRGLDSHFGETASRPQVLGTAEWQRLEASRPRAARYRTVFTTDFRMDDGPETRAFTERYRALAGLAPDRLAFIGYDLTRLLLEVMEERRSEEPLAEALRRARPWSGLAHRIDFAGGQVNQALFFLRYDGRNVVSAE